MSCFKKKKKVQQGEVNPLILNSRILAAEVDRIIGSLYALLKELESQTFKISVEARKYAQNDKQADQKLLSMMEPGSVIFPWTQKVVQFLEKEQVKFLSNQSQARTIANNLVQGQQDQPDDDLTQTVNDDLRKSKIFLGDIDDQIEHKNKVKQLLGNQIKEHFMSKGINASPNNNDYCIDLVKEELDFSNKQKEPEVLQKLEESREKANSMVNGYFDVSRSLIEKSVGNVTFLENQIAALNAKHTRNQGMRVSTQQSIYSLSGKSVDQSSGMMTGRASEDYPTGFNKSDPITELQKQQQKFFNDQLEQLTQVTDRYLNLADKLVVGINQQVNMSSQARMSLSSQ